MDECWRAWWSTLHPFFDHSNNVLVLFLLQNRSNSVALAVGQDCEADSCELHAAQILDFLIFLSANVVHKLPDRVGEGPHRDQFELLDPTIIVEASIVLPVSHHCVLRLHLGEVNVPLPLHVQVNEVFEHH